MGDQSHHFRTWLEYINLACVCVSMQRCAHIMQVFAGEFRARPNLVRDRPHPWAASVRLKTIVLRNMPTYWDFLILKTLKIGISSVP